MNFESIQNCPLFEGISEVERIQLCKCTGAKTETFSKGKKIVEAGTTAERIGILLSGRAQIVREDFWGNRSILASLQAGELFGEAFACAKVIFPVGVVAADDCEVLSLDADKLMHTCPAECTFHKQAASNLLTITAKKNVGLTQTIGFLAKKTTREKLLAYLSDQAERAAGAIFKIPFDRQELADFLSVDRSAMSAELSKLRAEGVLDFEKNSFKLIRAAH